MKIGIITQPLKCNYGGIIQNYALQQVLRDMGHEPWTVDYAKYTWFNWTDRTCRTLVHKLLWHHRDFGHTPAEVEKEELPLRRFAYDHISLTEPRTRTLQRIVVEKYHFDAIVVGSDQVWRPCYNPHMERCFLSFAKGMNLRRVAYAASFGKDNWEFSPRQTRRCAALAKQFDGVSVREKSGVELCRKYLGVEATHVLDPTLLLSADRYMALCEDIPARKPFVFAYLLEATPEQIKAVKAFALRKGLPCIIKSADDTLTMEDRVELWLSCFRDAAFVITNSFHGTVFSVIFNKDFYVWSHVGRGNSRFQSLLSDFGLENRLIQNEIPVHDEGIAWGQVNERRRLAIDSSISWLARHLG